MLKERDKKCIWTEGAWKSRGTHWLRTEQIPRGADQGNSCPRRELIPSLSAIVIKYSEHILFNNSNNNSIRVYLRTNLTAQRPITKLARVHRNIDK
jgi:hypothetical protein